MGLVDLTTNLKSLRYGKDTVGGGNSNQPYVKTKIPDSFSKLGKTGGPDFLLRGGTLYPKIAANDASRLTQMFFDFKSASGPLFIAKQNLLSLTNVNSEAGYVPFEEAQGEGLLGSIGNFIKDSFALNQGIYTPLGTLTQTLGNGIGLHTNKQGLNPFKFKTTQGSPDGNTPLGLPTYLNTIATGGDEGNKSRLFGLLNKIDEKQDSLNLYTYSGGPGATLGVGKTNIEMVGDQRTGINNFFNGQLQFNTNFNNNTSNSQVGDSTFEFTPRPTPDGIDPSSLSLQEIIELNTTETTLRSVNYIPSIYNPGLGKNKNISDIKLGYGATTKYVSLLDPKIQSDYLNNEKLFNNGNSISPLTFTRNVYKPGTLTTNVEKLNSGVLNGTPQQQLSQEQIASKQPFSKTGKADDITDFAKIIAPTGSQNIPDSLPYTNGNKIEQRVNLGNPGKRANRQSYTIGRQELGENKTIETNSGYLNALDKINALPIYQSSAPTTNKVKNDLVKFRIGVISNKNPSLKTYIHFRAHIDSMSDNFSADWQSQKYMGRGENFYKYQGFDRSINLSWTVAAQSKQELIPMHQKLNYLASVCAPDYSDAGYMSGNLISLTIGGWCYEQVGIMKGLNLEIPTESPWEIAIPDDETLTAADGSGILSDASVKELPMIIKVTGFNFIPIHDFVPKVQKNTFNGQNLEGGGTFVGEYGPEHYIGLATIGGINNYTGGINNLNYIPKK